MFFNKKSAIKNCLLVCCILLVWLVVVAWTLESKGYQPQKNRNFTEEEMIRIGISRAIQRMLINPPSVVPVLDEDGVIVDFIKPALVIPYHDVDHFLAENPNGYKFAKWHLPSVLIEGKIFYKDKNGQIYVSTTKQFEHQSFLKNIRYLP